MRSRLSYGTSLLLLGLATVAVLAPGSGTAEDLGPNDAEIRRRIDLWKANPALTKGVSFEAPVTSPVPGTGTEKALAICMGLNRVDPTRYAGWSGPLTGCEGDADAMAEIATKAGFKVAVLKTRDAVRPRFEQLVLDAAKQLQDNGILLVSFSGHGGQVPDVNGDEVDDHEDETWCLYDGEILDDDLCVLWQQFKRPVRILIVADSCHSGTSAKAIPVREAARHALDVDPATRKALAPGLTAERVALLKDRFDARKKVDFRSTLPHAFKSMPKEAMDAIQATPALRDEYRQRGARFTKEEVSQDRVTASVITLAACQDGQQASDGERNGLFTETLVRVWRGGAFDGDYKKFHKALQLQMPSSSKPNLDPFGKGLDRFLAQKPFQVSN